MLNFENLVWGVLRRKKSDRSVALSALRIHRRAILEHVVAQDGNARDRSVALRRKLATPATASTAVATV
jgi:hypothetical protein